MFSNDLERRAGSSRHGNSFEMFYEYHKYYNKSDRYHLNQLPAANIHLSYYPLPPSTHQQSQSQFQLELQLQHQDVVSRPFQNPYSLSPIPESRPYNPFSLQHYKLSKINSSNPFNCETNQPKRSPLSSAPLWCGISNKLIPPLAYEPIPAVRNQKSQSLMPFSIPTTIPASHEVHSQKYGCFSVEKVTGNSSQNSTIQNNKTIHSCLSSTFKVAKKVNKPKSKKGVGLGIITINEHNSAETNIIEKKEPGECDLQSTDETEVLHSLLLLHRYNLHTP